MRRLWDRFLDLVALAVIKTDEKVWPAMSRAYDNPHFHLVFGSIILFFAGVNSFYAAFGDLEMWQRAVQFVLAATYAYYGHRYTKLGIDMRYRQKEKKEK